MLSSGVISRRISDTLRDWPAKMRSGAISAKGSNTNGRTIALGCGKVNRGLNRRSPCQSIRSRSSGRGSLSTVFGRRPNSRSKCWSQSNTDSGDSAAPTDIITAALRNGGDPGGQSTGADLQNEDCFTGPTAFSANRRIASRRIASESPRLEPRAITTLGSESRTVELGGTGTFQRGTSGKTTFRPLFWGNEARTLGFCPALALG